MTVIAFDGVTLAADKRCCYGSMIGTTTKIRRVDLPTFPGALVGGSGDYGSVEEMVRWIEAGEKAADFPAIQRTDKWAAMIVVDDTGARMYEMTPAPIRYDRGEPITLGSGREFARAALYLGCDARRAVEVACALDSGCGNGIDTLTLGGE